MRFTKFLQLALLALSLSMLSIVGYGQGPGEGTYKIPTGADPVAWEALKATRDTRYYIENLEGFEAEVIVNDNGIYAKGLLRYDVGKGADLQIKGLDEKATWPLELILTFLRHRQRPKYEEGDGRWPITFAEDDHSPEGRRVLLHDNMNSSYRIRDGRITEVKRNANGETFTISLLKEKEVEKGKYLPRYFTVTYVDTKSGVIKRTQAFTDTYRQINGVWFPSTRHVYWVEAGSNAVISRSIELSNVQLRLK